MQIKANTYIKRIFIYILSMMIIAISLSFFLLADLGMPVNSSIAYIVSLAAGIKYSNGMLISNTFFLVLQIVVLGRKFKPIQLLQLPLALAFGFMLDLACEATAFIQAVNYAQKFGLLILGVLCLSFGISLYIELKLIPMPLEGFSLALRERFSKYPLHKIKVVQDVVLVLATVTLSLVLLGSIKGVREGTAITAVLVGTLMGFFKKHQGWILRWAGVEDTEKSSK